MNQQREEKKRKKKNEEAEPRGRKAEILPKHRNSRTQKRFLVHWMRMKKMR